MIHGPSTGSRPFGKKTNNNKKHEQRKIRPPKDVCAKWRLFSDLPRSCEVNVERNAFQSSLTMICV